MNPSEVMKRYMAARGLRGEAAEAEAERLWALTAEQHPDLADLLDWSMREVGYCLETHGDAFQGAPR